MILSVIGVVTCLSHRLFTEAMDMLCYVMLGLVRFCHVMSGYVMLCHVMTCYVKAN